MNLKLFSTFLIGSALRASASTREEPLSTQPSLVATSPVNGKEIKALSGHGDNLAAPPHRESGSGNRLLQTSSVNFLSPLSGTTIGSDHSFQATASDPQGVSRVVFRIIFPDFVTTSDFDASLVSSDTYQLDLTGFINGNWAWQVWVQDQFGYWAFSTIQPFAVDVNGGVDGGNGGGGGGGGSGGGGGGEIVAGLQPSCLNDDTSTFNICLDLEGPSGGFEPWMASFVEAVASWENVIVGNLEGLESSLLPTPTTCTQYPANIDDLYICGESNFIDGAGAVLGSATPVFIRSGSNLPITGQMTFDTTDIDSLQADGTLVGVLEHEMGHVLGIGSLWEINGLYDGFSGQYASGTQAESEWNNIGCSGPLPVELDGGPGTAGGHWDEECLSNELMTGFLTGGTPLSRITLGSLSDLGYTVDMNAADAYGIADLGSCGSFCPEARRRNLREPQHRLLSKKGTSSRKLSDAGMAIAKEYARSELARMTPTEPMVLPRGVDYVADKLIEVFYMEDGNIHGVRFTSDDMSD